MPTRYGPAIAMGLIIGSAIMLDDVLMFNLHGEHHAPMRYAQMQQAKNKAITNADSTTQGAPTRRAPMRRVSQQE